MKRRLLALLTAVCLVIGMAPAVFADTLDDQLAEAKKMERII